MNRSCVVFFSLLLLTVVRAENPMQHYRQIAERPVATVQDLVDLIMMTRGDYAKYPSEAKRIAEARHEGWLKDQDAAQALDRGTLAFAVLKMYDVRSGWLFHLTKWNRYALRDVQEAGIVSHRYSEANPVSGEQLVGVIHSAEAYKAEREQRASHR